MRALVMTWILLMGLTLATAVAFNLGAPHSARLLWLAGLYAATVLKGRLILYDFLELRRARQWRGPALAGLAIGLAPIFMLLAAA